MRIAIVANTRTGSSTVFKYIKKSLNLYGINEPFNPKTKQSHSHINIWGFSDIVVKYIFVSSEYIEKIIEHFDKVIFLTREDDVEAAKSFIQAKKTDNWTDSYIFNEEHSKEIQEITSIRKEQKNFIRSFEGFQITYEQLFIDRDGINRLNKFLNIQSSNYEYLFDLKYRYRKGTDSDKLNIL